MKQEFIQKMVDEDIRLERHRRNLFILCALGRFKKPKNKFLSSNKKCPVCDATLNVTNFLDGWAEFHRNHYTCFTCEYEYVMQTDRVW
jgi:hypothetical protein